MVDEPVIKRRRIDSTSSCESTSTYCDDFDTGTVLSYIRDDYWNVFFDMYQSQPGDDLAWAEYERQYQEITLMQLYPTIYLNSIIEEYNEMCTHERIYNENVLQITMYK